ncbi:MAG: hypothetical protein QXN17_08080 [Nitrososphaerota archaeon]
MVLRDPYIPATIIEINQLTENIREYCVKLDKSIDPEPGQFAMIWIPKVGEIPISFADWICEEKIAVFVIARVGKVTGYIQENFKTGSKMYVRGPLGRSFTIREGAKCLLMGGGYGLAPLYYLAKKLLEKKCRLKIILGFKNGSDVFYVNKFRVLGDTEISTEDGKIGVRGTLIDVLEKVMNSERYDMVYACGREELLIKIALICNAKNTPLEVSMERLIKCGQGVCGACVIEPSGLLVCRDGPVFDGKILLEVKNYSSENSTGSVKIVCRGVSDAK